VMRARAKRAKYPPICALILVDCFVVEVPPNGLICAGQQLAGLKLLCRTGIVDLTVFPARSRRA
jgi:hypothetical protein